MIPQLCHPPGTLVGPPCRKGTLVGFGLATEVLNYAPPELSTQERFLTTVIAMLVNDTDPSRTCRVDVTDLAHWMGYKDDEPNRIYQLLRRMAARGYDLRVPVGTTRNGKPRYVYPGGAAMYRLPVFK